MGSNPTLSATVPSGRPDGGFYTLAAAPVAQLDRASGYGPEGRGFESLQARQVFEDAGSLTNHVVAQTLLFAPSRRLSRLEIISSSGTIPRRPVVSAPLDRNCSSMIFESDTTLRRCSVWATCATATSL